MLQISLLLLRAGCRLLSLLIGFLLMLIDYFLKEEEGGEW
jgi:hypothetical protein